MHNSEEFLAKWVRYVPSIPTPPHHLSRSATDKDTQLRVVQLRVVFNKMEWKKNIKFCPTNMSGNVYTSVSINTESMLQ